MFYVENLPKNCAYCDCCHTRDCDSRYQIDGEKFCGIENVNIPARFLELEVLEENRPNWCQLRKLEIKKEKSE